MTIEFWALLIAAMALPVLASVAAGLYGQQVGLLTLMKNRDGLPEPTGAAARARRAHLNLLENALPFAAVVLMAHVMGVSNGWTIAGALVFLGARIVHYAAYLMGITSGIRSLAYHLGTVGTVMIAIPLLVQSL